MNGTAKLAKDLGPLIDELGLLEREISAEYAEAEKKLGTKLARAAVLRQQILARYEKAAPGMAFAPEGETAVAMLTAREHQTTITSMAKVYKLLGNHKFLLIASVTLGKLRKALTDEDLATCTKTTRSGPRMLSIVEKGAAAK